MKSNQRILTTFARLYAGQRLTLAGLLEEYRIGDVHTLTDRTLRRDFQNIQEVFAEQSLPLQLVHTGQDYFLQTTNQIAPKEILALGKILLASRAFDHETLQTLLDHLTEKLAPDQQQKIERLLANERLLYRPAAHNDELLELIETFSYLITEQTVIEFDYQKNRGQLVTRKALPVALYFSEYYFYAICYNPKYESYLNYRLDRFIQITPTAEKIKIDHKNRLEEGELRKKLHFMYRGKEVTFTFRFWGIVEAALDRLPASKVIKKYDDQSVTIEATAYDTGVMMWLLSQGSNVQVLSPPSFVTKVKTEIEKMNSRYQVNE